MMTNSEIVLSILFVLYLVFYENNMKIAQIVDIPQIKVAIVLIALLLFIHGNKILGILGLFVAFEMIHFTHIAMNDSIVNNLHTNDEHSFSTIPMGMESIEEEMVYKMMPLVGVSNYLDKCPYKPMSSIGNVFSF